MRLLLDTHILFWCLVNDSKFDDRLRAAILDPTSACFVSAVTGWDIAVKVRLGKWPEAGILLPDLASKITAARMQHLPLTLLQAERAGSLVADHKDPFDRLLAAQSIDLDMPMVTVDAAFARMGCFRLG